MKPKHYQQNIAQVYYYFEKVIHVLILNPINKFWMGILPAKKILNCHLAAPQPTLGHYWEYSLIHPMLITALFNFQPKG